MKILSIEIGSDVTRVAEVDYKVKNPKIYHYFSFTTPEGMIGDGVVKKNEVFRKSLMDGLGAQHIKTRKVVFAVSSGKIANREITIPLVKENRIQSLLNANSADYFPVDLAQYQLVYRIVADAAAAKEKKRKLFVLAVPNDLVHSYEDIASYCKLELESLEYSGNAIFQTMRRTTMADKRRMLSVKIDEDSAMVTIINQGELDMQRTIFYGIAEAENVIRDSGVTDDGDYRQYKSAREMLERECMLNAHLDDSHGSMASNEERLLDEVTETLRPLIGNINRVVDYYLSTHEGVEIKECTLIGNAVRIKGLRELLANEMGMKIELLTNELQKITLLPKNIELEKYIVCYGATLYPLKFTFGERQNEEIAKQKKRKEMFAAQLFLLFCVLVCIGMLGVQFGRRMLVNAEIDKQTSRKNELSYIEDIYNAFVAAQSQYVDVIAMGDAATTTSDELSKVIVEMEAKLPSNAVVSSLTSDGGSVTMQMNVADKTEAAKVIEVLSGFESFSEVSTDGIVETTDESGLSTVSFTVTCIYVNGEMSTEESTETTPEEDAATYQSQGATTSTGDTLQEGSTDEQ